MPRDDLSTPRGARGRPVYDPDAFGRAAEALARFLGTGRYLAALALLVAGWITLNVVAAGHRLDPFPFTLLNLALAMQAAFVAPLILYAQNRQADRDRTEAAREREASASARADMDYVAREIAAIRIALRSKAGRDEWADVTARLDEVLDRLPRDGR